MDLTDYKAALIEDEDIRGTTIRWSDYMTDPIEDDRLSKRPESDAVYYEPVPGWMLNASSIRSRESDFIDSIYRDGRTVVYSNKELPFRIVVGISALCGRSRGLVTATRLRAM